MLFMLLALTHVFAKVFADECLECYECISKASDPNPFCTSDYWHILTPKKRVRYVVGCPEYARDFCVKKEVFGPNGQITERGCVGPEDMVGTKLKSGCAIMEQNGSTTKICLCSENLCNISNQNMTVSIWLLLIISQLYVLGLIIFPIFPLAR